MIKALSLLKEYKANIDGSEISDELIEEEIVYLYLGMRLEPLVKNEIIEENRVNELANIIADKYFDYAISLDTLINAVYNYINKNNLCPPDQFIDDNIETFLKEYAI